MDLTLYHAEISQVLQIIHHLFNIEGAVFDDSVEMTTLIKIWFQKHTKGSFTWWNCPFSLLKKRTRSIPARDETGFHKQEKDIPQTSQTLQTALENAQKERSKHTQRSRKEKSEIK